MTNGRAEQMVEIAPEFFKQFGFTLVDLPPVDWYIDGPRGGLYQAVGSRTRQMMQDWDGRMYIIDRSDGLRYLRPGTRRHREAMESIR